jgi:hypothetical protein
VAGFALARGRSAVVGFIRRSPLKLATARPRGGFLAMGIRGSSFATLLLGLSTAASIQARSFCVGTTNELRRALLDAETNGEDDLIRIKTGTYDADTASVVAYFRFAQNHALTLRGGYRDVGTSPCAALGSNPRVTIVTGSSSRRPVEVFGTAGMSARVTLQNFTVLGGDADRGGGIEVWCEDGFAGDVTIERVHFIGNRAAHGAALYTATSGTLTLRNTVFRNHAVFGDVAAALIDVDHANTQSPRVFVGGRPRLHDARYDIGAFENDEFLFRDGFDDGS